MMLGSQNRVKLLLLVLLLFSAPPACETAHLRTGHGSVLVPLPVQQLQHLLARRCLCVDVLRWRSHTHHQDLLTVRRLAHDEGIVLRVRQHWHQCSAAAAPPAPPLPEKGGSQQSWAHSEGGGGDERWWGNSGGLQICTVWNKY